MLYYLLKRINIDRYIKTKFTFIYAQCDVHYDILFRCERMSVYMCVFIHTHIYLYVYLYVDVYVFL